MGALLCGGITRLSCPSRNQLYKCTSDRQRSHPTPGCYVVGIEDIGKEADKWDDKEPIGTDVEFTVSYGV